MAIAFAVTIGSRWAGRSTPVPSRIVDVRAAAAARTTSGIDGPPVLLGQLGVAGGRRRDAADGDVRVLRQVQRIEAPGLGLDRQVVRRHRPIGREHRHPVAHGHQSDT